MADRPLTEEQYRHLADEHGLDETCARFVRDLAGRLLDGQQHDAMPAAIR